MLRVTPKMFVLEHGAAEMYAFKQERKSNN